MATTAESTELAAKPHRSPGAESSDFIDLGGLWMALRRRSLLFGVVGLIVAVLVMVGYFLTPPRYDATSQIVVSTDQEKVVNTPQVVTSEQPDTYAVDTEVQVLKSRTLARQVVNKLHLYTNPEFVIPDPDGPKLSAQAARQRDIEAATDTLLLNREASRSGLAFVIDVKYSSPSPQTAAAVANALASEYVGTKLNTRVRATDQASTWLYGRLVQMRTQVNEAENAVQQYRAAHGLLNTTDDTVGQQGLNTMGTELATAQGELAEKRVAAASARAQIGRTGSASEAQSSPVITQLRQQRAQISAQVADLSTRYGPAHPDLQRARSQLRDIDGQIAAELGRIATGLEGQAQAARGRVASLQSSIGQSRGTLQSANLANPRLAELERNAEAVRTLYQTYLARYRETSTQRGLETSGSRVLTLASEPPLPEFPKKSIFLILAVLAGLIAGCVAVALVEMLDHTARSSADIRSSLGLRTLASIPEFRSSLHGQERRSYGKLDPSFIVERPFAAFTESFRMLRAALLGAGGKRPYKVVAITSSLPGEGKTTLATCLARVSAIGGERTILVQCDTRRQRAQGDNAVGAGLLEVLSDKIDLDKVIRVDAASGAFILPTSEQAPTPRDILTSTAMDTLLDKLATDFDLVILDMAPVLPIAEARLLAAKADATVFVVRWGRTPKSASAAGVRMLQESNANVIGVALTQIDMRRQKNWDRQDASAYFGDYRRYYS